MKNSLLNLLASLFLTLSFFAPVTAQTVLTAGQLAIIRMNGQGQQDQFSFVLLTAVDAGTKIRFTDQGWRAASNTFQGNGEAHLEWTAPVGGLLAGAVITVTEDFNADPAVDVFTTSAGTTVKVSGTFNLSSQGDQLFAYQGTPASPTFLFAIQSNSTIWQAVPGSNKESSLPMGLTDGVNAVAAGSGAGSLDAYRNIQYNMSLTAGTSATLLAAIANAANWEGRDTPVYITPLSSFSLTTFPVEWLSFDAEVEGQSVVLQWATATEINNDFFAIERSVDGLAYTTLGTVAGSGTSQEVLQYTFKDIEPVRGNNFYRIRQVDFDGAFDFSDVVSIELTADAIASIRMYPNPVSEQLFVEAPGGRLIIHNLMGQEVQSYFLSAGYNALDVTVLQPGHYIARLVFENQLVSSYRFVK